MKFNVIFYLILTIQSLCFGQTTGYFLPKPNQPIHVELFNPESKTSNLGFLFLPGMNRGWTHDELFLIQLRDKKIPYVTMNFSAHPFSLNRLNNSTSPYFKTDYHSISSLAQEVEVVKKYYEISLGLELIPVTLSYSGIISPLLNHKFLIETAPMTSTSKAYPEFALYKNMLYQTHKWNPFNGDYWVRFFLDQEYERYWSIQVKESIKKYNLSPENEPLMIQGYTRLSQLAEDQEWPDLINNSQKRIFILAGKESKKLLQHQLEQALFLINKNQKVLIYFIPESQHAIPNSSPVIYFQILMEILNQKNLENINPIDSKTSPPNAHLMNTCLTITNSAYPSDWHRADCYQTQLWLEEFITRLKD